MLKILKTEIKYFKLPLIIIVLLLLSFTLFSLSDIVVFENSVFLYKYFWAMTIGLGSYALVFIIWMQRVKEQHERIVHLLPLSTKVKSNGRLIFAVLPFLLIIVYIQLMSFLLPENWDIQIGRISGQLGFLSIALASLFVIRDVLFVIGQKNDLYIMVAGISVFTLAAIGTIAIIWCFNYDIVSPFYIHQEELLFFLWGFLISMASLFLYPKRKSYLE